MEKRTEIMPLSRGIEAQSKLDEATGRNCHKLVIFKIFYQAVDPFIGIYAIKFVNVNYKHYENKFKEIVRKFVNVQYYVVTNTETETFKRITKQQLPIKTDYTFTVKHIEHIY
ncbi:MAG: hypothetical protein [Microviridae sp.]|nr:MAG: hypothetical protein [Microviridae sp.]